MSLSGKVAKFLGRKRRYINFNFYGNTITWESLEQVADAIAGGEISIGKSDKSGWAFYDPQTKTLTLSDIRNDNYGFGSLIIHEAIHAYHHLSATHSLQKHKEILLVADEGCAYITQGIYLRHHGLNYGGMGHPVDQMALFYILDNLVKKKSKASTPGPEVVKQFINWLKSLKLDERSGPAYDVKSKYTYQ